MTPPPVFLSVQGALFGLLVLTASTVWAQPVTLEPARSLGETRVALVLGNSAYEHATPLENPSNDAADITAALRRVGFTVVSGIDLTHEEMDMALSEFVGLAEGADAALFFYAGHGVQIGGENYLLPIDALIRNEVQVSHRSLGLGEVLDYLDASNSRLKIVVLDACRDNPFAGAWRSTSGGWAATSGPSGSVIAYATAPGARASDNMTGRNGLYTSALLEEIEAPGIELGKVFSNVYTRVKQASGGVQEPWTSQSYDGAFFFLPESAAIDVDALNGRIEEAVAAFERGDIEPHVAALEEASSLGHAEAQSLLGYLYQQGLGVEADMERAVELYQAAASSGHAAAQANLGLCYERGLGVPRDDAEAARLYELASEQGRVVAKNNLAAMLQHGRGIDQDVERALSLYLSAAEEGLATATVNAAFAFENGIGTDPDLSRAFDLYLTAARADHPWAAYRTGWMYGHGVGTEVDPEAAREWLSKAVAAGVADAEAELATMPE